MTVALEIAIGLGFVYLLFSAITSALVEWMAALSDRRSKNLRRSLNAMLGPDLRRKLLTHPAIAGIAVDESADPSEGPWLWWSGRTPPNYLAPRAVALALADISRHPVTTNGRVERRVRRDLTADAEPVHPYRPHLGRQRGDLPPDLPVLGRRRSGEHRREHRGRRREAEHDEHELPTPPAQPRAREPEREGELADHAENGASAGHHSSTWSVEMGRSAH